MFRKITGKVAIAAQQSKEIVIADSRPVPAEAHVDPSIKTKNR